LFTTWRVLTVLYGAAMLFIAFRVVPKEVEQSHVLASRYLGANTRLVTALWVEPRELSWQARIDLDRLERELVGKYIKASVDAGEKITRDNLISWPDLAGKEVLGVALEGEPEWLTVNHGSAVRVWTGTKPTPTQIEAIVGLGQTWVALVCRTNAGPELPSSTEEKLTLRLMSPPQKPASPPACRSAP
jgi:hypothetical protein